MELEIKKDPRNRGYHFDKQPRGTGVSKAKRIALMDITEHYNRINDRENRNEAVNFVHRERSILEFCRNQEDIFETLRTVIVPLAMW